MKKVLLSAALLGGMLFGANAQEEAAATSAGDYKQEAGDKSVELVLNPGAIFASANTPQVGLLENSIKLRSFSTETSAMRLIVNLAMDNGTTISNGNGTTNDIDLKTKTSQFNVMLRPGIEKHFASSKRLSPYVGGEATIGFQSSSTKTEVIDGADKITENKTTGGDSEDGFTFGVGVFAGVDYYFVKKFYIGAEVGYGLTYFSQATTKTTNGADSSLDSENKNGGTFKLAPALATGNIRIGWTF